MQTTRIWTLLLTCGFHLAGGSHGATAGDRPNFLVIVADDLGFSDLGCYGGEINTPHLDALAAAGLRYTQFYNTARCWPTRAALLTGYYAQQVGRDKLPGGGGGSRGKRPPWARLLPHYLRPLGYRSYISGKWHVDGTAADGGFDRSYLLEDHNRFFTPQKHLEDGNELPHVSPDDNYYATTAIADYAINYLREHSEEHAERPFFQYLAFTSPHFPLHALAEDIERYRSRYQVGWDAIRAERWQRMQAMFAIPGELGPLEPHIGPPYHFPDAREILGAGEVYRELIWTELTPEQRAFQAVKMSIHAAMVDRIDRELGRVVEQLRAMKALENTVIFFLSDNGASAEIMIRGDGHDAAAAPGSAASYLCLGPGWSRAANTPFRRHKTWVHEGGIATPLVVHWPSRINSSGTRHRAIGHVIDIAPTIVELAGGAWPHEWQATPMPTSPGRSLVQTFADDVPVERDVLWWLHEGNRAIRQGDRKLVAARDQPWELYDLSRDRCEVHNLASEQPERVASLSERWQRMTDQMRDN